MAEKEGKRVEVLARIEWVVLALLLVGLGLALRHLPVREALESATMRIEALGWWAPAAFVGLYVLCTVLLVPRTVLTVAAGFLFGFAWGTMWALVALHLGANAAFFLGRRFVRRTTLARRFENDRLRSLDEAVGRDGWRIVALTRMTPLLPYSLMNYAFGLTRVGWSQYAIGSFLGMLPGTLLLVGLGTLTDFAAERSGETESGLWHLAILVGGVVATVATLVVTRFAKRALDRRRIRRPS